MGESGLVGTLCATLEELYTERTGPQTHSNRVHSVQFHIYSGLYIVQYRTASFLTLGSL